jgi:uncharacterized protein (TIGR03437 family)
MSRTKLRQVFSAQRFLFEQPKQNGLNPGDFILAFHTVVRISLVRRIKLLQSLLLLSGVTLLSSATILIAKPVIYPHSVVNAASFFAPGLPAGSIAQGSIFSLFGTGLGPAQGMQQSAFPLTTTVAGVSIQVKQGATSVNALPLFVVAGQVNALMPSNTPLGWVSVWVTYNGQQSNPSPVLIVHDSPGIFTATGTGIGPAAVQNAINATSVVPNSNQASAKPGQTEVLYLTGLGPISAPDNQPAPPGNLPTPVEVWVGGISAAVAYSGRSPCCSGLDQIDFVVPPNAPQGCWVPVAVRTSNVTVANYVSMAIDPAGAPCSDPSNTLSAAIVQGGRLGELTLTRIVVHEDVGVNAAVDVSNDYATYAATNQPGGQFAFTPFLSTPPVGTCTVYPGAGEFFDSGQVPQGVIPTLNSATQLSIAAISGQGTPQNASLTNSAAVLGSSLPLYSLPNQLYLNSGTYSVGGNAGSDVSAFTASVAVPSALNWINQDQITIVNRSQPLMLTWTNGGSQPVGIMGIASDLPTNSSALFLCLATPGSITFTVPPQVLSALPPSQPDPLKSKSVIYLVSSTASTFTANGLDSGLASGVYIAGKTVILQ